MKNNQLALLCAALLQLGCERDTAQPARSEEGRYTLLMVDGKAPPGVLADGNLSRVVALSGVLRLKAGGVFVDSTELQVTTHADRQTRRSMDVATGTYAIARDTIYFRSSRPGERYFMIFLTAGALKQELGSAHLIYAR